MNVTMIFDENSQHLRTADKGPTVSVVLLTYNSRKFVDPCVESLSRQTLPLQIVVVDNASADGSAEVAEQALAKFSLAGHIAVLPKNLGCAGGNNYGWMQTSADIVIFLNPDTVLEPDCLENLVRPMVDDQSIGITGAKMYYPGGRILQHAGGIVHPNGMTNHCGAGDEDRGQHDELRDVDYVTGAALAIRRELLVKIGGFDEDYYPAYYEEVDLCLQVRRAGYRVVYVPTAVLVHHESPTLGQRSAMLHQTFPRMRFRYLVKNLTLRQLLGWALPFEYQWMRHEPAARSHRWEQIRYGLIENIPWMWRRWFKKVRKRARKSPPN